MKRFAAAALAVVFLVLFAACGGEESSASAPESSSVSAEEPVSLPEESSQSQEETEEPEESSSQPVSVPQEEEESSSAALPEEPVSQVPEESSSQAAPPESEPVSQPAESSQAASSQPVETTPQASSAAPETAGVTQEEALSAIIELDTLDIGKEILSEINDEREELGIEPLAWSQELADAAAVRSEELTIHDEVWAHTRVDGRAWNTIFAEQGISGYGSAGENLACASANSPLALEEVEDPHYWYTIWKGSPDHHAAMIDESYTKAGISVHYKLYEQDGETYLYAVGTTLFTRK